MKTERQIAWEKWVDPYGDNTDDVAWPGAFGTFETDDIVDRAKRRAEGEDIEWNEDEYKGIEGKPSPTIITKTKPTRVLATPVGLVPLTEWTTPSRIFNFWVIHSNFRMTPEIQEVLDNTDGIETLDVFTPYRWRISIGKAFDTIEVKEAVMKNLNAKPLKCSKQPTKEK